MCDRAFAGGEYCCYLCGIGGGGLAKAGGFLVTVTGRPRTVKRAAHVGPPSGKNISWNWAAHPGKTGKLERQANGRARRFERDVFRPSGGRHPGCCACSGRARVWGHSKSGQSVKAAAAGCHHMGTADGRLLREEVDFAVPGPPCTGTAFLPQSAPKGACVCLREYGGDGTGAHHEQ